MLLQLREPVTDIAPLPVGTPALTAPATSATTMGRGATAPSGTGAGGFRTGVVAVQDDASCPRVLPTPAWRAWSLCTRDPRLPDPAATPPFVSACLGDSGGPLTVDGATGPLLIGVVSFGPYCGKRRDPEVYADATAAADFITRPDPPWAPAARGASIQGEPHVGTRLRCAVDWRVRPSRRLRFEWFSDGRFRKGSKEPGLRLRRRDAGSRLRCSARGATAGGYGVSPQSPAVRVAQRAAR
jgi:hypothetical protein